MRLPRDRPGDTRKAGDHSAYPTILALVGYYPPAYRAGGPTRSVPPIAELLKHEFDFLVVTRDRDLGAKVRLAVVVSDSWVECGSAR